MQLKTETHKARDSAVCATTDSPERRLNGCLISLNPCFL